MVNKQTLKSSLDLLTDITNQSYSVDVAPIANNLWRKQLQLRNPLWKNVTVQSFSVQNNDGSAHVIAMIDKRLPNMGLVGFFGATTKESGTEVLRLACKWLKKQPGIKDAYGPINGTITNDYRFNFADDCLIPGEPVNPTWYIDVFQQAGFEVFNRYVSGIVRHAQLYIRLAMRNKAVRGYRHITLHNFQATHEKQNLTIYHNLMNAIFPANSIYCPVITLEERTYNMEKSNPLFDPNYCYFAYDQTKPIGFIVAYPHEGNLVIKTIGLLPEYRGKRISDLLVRKVHDQAKKNGLKSAIYSTIRTTTAVYKMKRPGLKIYRRYATMRKKL